MNRLMVCPTCEGEGRIEDRREQNRDEEEDAKVFLDQYYEGENKKKAIFNKLTTLEPSLLDAKAYPNLNGLFGRKEEEPLKYVKKDWKKYSFLTTSRYACKIEYDENAKELIAYLRKLGKSNGFSIRVRGSGPRSPQHRKDGKDLRRIYDQSLPLKFAEQVRIYIDYK